MAQPQTACPAAGAAAYAVTSHVTPGAFLSLAQYWDRLVARPASMDQAAERLQRSAVFQGLRATIRNREPMRLEAVRLAVKSDGTPPHYILTVRSRSAAWTLLLDNGPKGVELIGAGTLH